MLDELSEEYRPRAEQAKRAGNWTIGLPEFFQLDGCHSVPAVMLVKTASQNCSNFARYYGVGEHNARRSHWFNIDSQPAIIKKKGQLLKLTRKVLGEDA